MTLRRTFAGAALVIALVAAGCDTGGDDGGAASPSTTSATTRTIDLGPTQAIALVTEDDCDALLGWIKTEAKARIEQLAPIHATADFAMAPQAGNAVAAPTAGPATSMADGAGSRAVADSAQEMSGSATAGVD